MRKDGLRLAVSMLTSVNMSTAQYKTSLTSRFFFFNVFKLEFLHTAPLKV